MEADKRQFVLQRWNPVCRFAGLSLLIAAMSFANSFPLLLLSGTCALASVILSGLPPSEILKRFRIPLLLVLSVALVIAFSSGSRIIVRIMFLSLREEGLVKGGILTGRLVCILTTGLVLFNAFPHGENLRAMRKLGFPSIIVDMILLTGRFIHQFRSQLSTMKKALQVRGYSFGKVRMGTLSMIAGSLLVNGYSQSEEVYRAIILRGGSASFRSDCPAPGIRDLTALVLVVLLSAFLIIESILPGVLI